MAVRRYSEKDMPALLAIVAKPEVARWWGRFDRKRLKGFVDSCTLLWTIEGRGHHRATLYTTPDNERAIHVYEKLGFRRVGVLRRSSREPGGDWHDELLMELLAEEMT